MPSTTTTPSTREARYSPLKTSTSTRASSSPSPHKPGVASSSSSPSKSGEGERPRKRRRGDDDEAEVKKGEGEGKIALKRDPEYFFEDDKDARMFIRVEDTLFKIHGKKMYKSQTFKNRLKMFLGEGDRIEDPVHLSSTTVDSFRLLLGALYTSPLPPVDKHEMEYTDQTACQAVSLWRTARVYEFVVEEKWALGLVERVCGIPEFMDSCGSSTLRELVECLCVSQTKETLGNVEKKWAERVRKAGTPSVPAIYASEQFGLTRLAGVAYYQHVLDMLDRQHGDEVANSKHTPQRIRLDPKLNPDQIQRVLSGYMSLVTFWEHFRLTPLPVPIPLGSDCAQHEACKMNWDRRWGSAIGWKRILGISSADVLALIACLRDQLKGDEELKIGMEAKCREAGLEALRVCLEEMREGLAGYFWGPR